MVHPLTETHVRTAASALIDAFRRTDTDAYFGCFAETATFVFHSDRRARLTKSEYETQWSQWIAWGWRVSSCESTDVAIMLLGETAVFTHSVATTTVEGDLTTELAERETIVFRRDESGLVTAVHEHLSSIDAE